MNGGTFLGILASAVLLAPQLVDAAGPLPQALNPSAPANRANVADDSDAELMRSLLAAHNREREKEKLAPLTFDDKLMAAARAHAEDMARHDKMTHEGSDGSTPFDRIKRQNYGYRTAGENVAEGQRTVPQVMTTWMNSPPHRENILGKFTQAGMAVARSDDGNFYWCVDFGTPWTRVEPTAAATDLIDAMNKERAEAKRPPLKANPKLNEVASEVARSFATDDSLQPAGDKGNDLAKALNAAGYRFRTVAEAAASGQDEARDVVTSWMQSQAHRENVLGPFQDAGVGYAVAKSGKPYWCLILARPLTE